MKCAKCGNELEHGEGICPVCGERVSKDIDDKESAIFKECAEGMKGDEIDTPAEEATDKHAEKNERRPPQKPADDRPRRMERQREADETKRWSPKNLIIGLLIAFLIIGAGTGAGYYAYSHSMGASSKDYIESSRKLEKSIDKLNGDFAKVLNRDEDELPADDLLKQIPNTMNALNSIIADYRKVPPPSVYSDQNKKLVEALNLNKAIFQQLKTVLEAPTNANAAQNFDRLSETINSCINKYSSVQISNLDFSLPNEMLTLTSRMQPWLDQKQAAYQQVALFIDSYSKYFESIENLSLGFDAARADFNQTLTSVRTNQSKWTALFNQLDDSEIQLKNMQSEYKSISVPSDFKTFNKGYSKVLQDSLLYISKLRSAAQAERSFKKDGLSGQEVATKQKRIDTLYDNAEKVNSAVKSENQKFFSQMNDMKGKYLDVEYVLSIKKK